MTTSAINFHYQNENAILKLKQKLSANQDIGIVLDQ